MRVRFNTAFGPGEILLVSSSWEEPDQILVRGSNKEIKEVIREWLGKSYGATGHLLTELASPEDLHAAVAATDKAVSPFLLGSPQILEGAENIDYQTDTEPGGVS